MATTVTMDEVLGCGVPANASRELAALANRALTKSAVDAWREIATTILHPSHPFALHRLLHDAAFVDWDTGRLGPPPAWTPERAGIERTNVGRLMSELGLQSVAELYAWSIADRARFWQCMIERLGISLARPTSAMLDLSAGVQRPRWLVGARLNIVDSCFQAEPAKLAVVYHDESGRAETLTYGQLVALVNRVANGVRRAGFQPGDALAVYLPMSIESVAIYLGIIRAGCVAVSIADSLAAEEIATRLRLSAARGVFTQDVLLRGGKQLPLYAKMVEAGAPRAVVIVTDGSARLRAGDVNWNDFLSDDDQFESYLAEPHEHTNILFSSGTTGEPKAIPWTHVSPIKCAVDGHLHQDVQPTDRVAWPTNLGWMMGPWLIYASLVNRATIALYGGAPTGRGFGQFVQDARVSMLGVIPSLVKTWRATECMRGLEWQAITRFSSTGECSNADDMLYLMSLAGYRPVIEYCGGTELAGGYIGATMAEPNIPATFSCPSFGTELVQINDPGNDNEAGEVFLVPPAIGMSSGLLHHDHDAVYFDGAPRGPAGQTLRRHGDAMERLPGGAYRAGGRVDDTMNLGGIKVSSVEIERLLNTVPGIRETAAVAVSPPGGGPSALWAFAVLQPDCQKDELTLKAELQATIRAHLNPLFKIDQVRLIEALPRTASHKIMRRVLRDEAGRSRTQS